MVCIKTHKVDDLIHDLINIAQILKMLESNSLTDGQRQMLHGCEVRLYEIRDDFLQSIEQNNASIKEE